MIKDVKDFEGLYTISSDGEVVSLDRYNVDKNGKRKFYPGRKLKPYVVEHNHTSYAYLTLCKEGTTKKFGLHQLLAINFIENTENKPHINHTDNNGLNNALSNLEWVTHSENMLHAQKQGRLYSAQSRGGKTLGKTEHTKKETFNKYLTYVGSTLNSLLVLSVFYKDTSKIYFKCTCTKCGKDVEVYAVHVVNGIADMCGTCKRQQNTERKVIEDIGTVYGDVSILSYSGRRSCDNATLVHVKCACGTEWQTAHKNLKNGNIQRCQPCSRKFNTFLKKQQNLKI